MTTQGVAVVTGGAQGIGAAVARALATRGLAVAILDINDDLGKAVAADLGAAGHDAARVGVSYEAVYAGAKAGVIGFSKSLAVEIARSGVRVNVVSPGSTRTPLLDALFTPDDLAKRVRIIPMGRFGEPEDVAASIVFLALDATHVTGQVISVNGGATRVG
jgi:NAD(P)-dependent dehydrogenase (short-subunit alcohol dehydrogenase family)